MKNKLIIAILLLVSTLVYPQNKRGIALIIGNSNYSEGYLKNPVNDATAVGEKLQTLGFDVLLHTDLNLRQMKETANSFIDKASNYDVALFYYAGHGIQSKGLNYLLPLNAKLERENDIEWECMNLARVIDNLNYTKCKLKFVMIDACRNNPLERSFTRSIHTGGLVKQNTPIGTLISYATDYGKTAKDGEGKHSPYTSAFLELLDRPNMEYKDLFEEIKYLVAQRTNYEQFPVVEDKIYERGSFCFNLKINSSILTAEEMNLRGDDYLFGKNNTEKNYSEAVKWYRKAAELGNPKAQNSLAKCYEHGLGVKINHQEVIKWYNKAAEQGYYEAFFNLGNYYHHLTDYDNAYTSYNKGAKMGEPYSQVALAQWYSFYYRSYCSTHDIKYDYEYDKVKELFSEAENAIQKSAEEGEPLALIALSIMYNQNYYESQTRSTYNKNFDTEEYENIDELKYLSQAAEGNDGYALYKLAEYYYLVYGLTKNNKYSALAIGFAQKAYKKGYIYATTLLGEIYWRLNDSENSKYWFTVGKDIGLASSIHHYGLNCSDPKEKLSHLTSSLEQGYLESYYELGKIYYDGDIVNQDYKRAFYYFKKGAELGSDICRPYVALCYLNGHGVKKDIDEAKKWYKKAIIKLENKDLNSALK